MGLRATIMALRALFRRSSVEGEMEREMRFHIEAEVEANVRQGMDPDEARRRAMVAFGGVDRHKEGVRDERGVRAIEDTIADATYALRTLSRNRGFTALAILTLAVGIGATASVYTLANWILFRPVPGVASPGELVIVSFEEAPGQTTGFSHGTLLRASRDVTAFAGVMGSSETTIQLTGDGITARELRGEIVAGNYFGVLGVQPRLGRFFTPEELDPQAGGRQIVISAPLWESQFAGDSAIVGSSIRFNGTDFIVVGVAPAGFRGIERLGDSDAWFPPAAYAALRHSKADVSAPGRRVFRAMVARLRPGATIELAQSQMTAVAKAMTSQNPKAYEIYDSRPPVVYRDVGTPIWGRDRARQTVILLFAIVAVVLLIACANVANLLLLRALVRAPEFAVRRALGASRSRILRLHSAEGLIIGIGGGVAGMLVALGVARVLFSGRQFTALEAAGEIGVDWRVLAFVFALAAATGLLFGVVPAMVSLRRNSGALAEAGRRATGGRGRVRAALMLVQVTGCVALLACAALLARSLRAMNDIELGFEPRQLTMFLSIPDLQGYTDERLATIRPQILSALRGTPGVDAAALATYGVPQQESWGTTLRGPNDAGDEWPHEGRVAPVSDGYFATLGIRIVAGRDFAAAELAGVAQEDAPAIINATAARRLFGDAPAVGRTLEENTLSGAARRRIIGVVADARAAQTRSAPEAVLYLPMSLAFQSYVNVLVRSALPAPALDSLVRRTIARVDPVLPVGRVVPVTDIVRDAAREERLFLRLVSLLSVMAAVLSAVGLYGVTAYAVAQRRREIGIRVALGAGVRAIVAAVTRQAAFVVALGVLVGLAAATALARALGSRLYGVEAFDPASYAATAVAFAAIALVACAAPARAAAKVDPTEALRLE